MGKSLCLAFLLSFAVLGCDSLPSVPASSDHPSHTVTETVREQIEQAEEITTSSEVVGDHLKAIESEAEDILWSVAKVPDEDMTNTLVDTEQRASAIKDHVREAEKEQVRIEEALEDLKAANDRAAAAIGQISGLEDLIVEYEKTDREIRQEAVKNLRGFISLAFAIGFCLLVGGAFVALKIDGKLGGVMAGVGILAVGFAAASQYYLEEIALVGLVALVVGFILVVFMVGSNLARGKEYESAIREVVELIEEIKDYMSDANLGDMRKEIFGPSGFANRFQNEITKKIVAEVKAKNNFDKLSRKTKGQA